MHEEAEDWIIAAVALVAIGGLGYLVWSKARGNLIGNTAPGASVPAAPPATEPLDYTSPLAVPPT